jgi:hypothetical protein
LNRLYQGTASQLAEKVVRAVGRGFIPGMRDAISTGALAPEVWFGGISLEPMPFFSKLFSRAAKACKG